MSRRAFSVVEILIVLFIILLVASVFIPLNIANVKQAGCIAKWKNTFAESKYSFQLLRAQNPSMFMPVMTNKQGDSASVFNVVKKYLNVDSEKSHPAYFANYNYRYLNGRRIGKKSKFYVTNFATLESGVIIGFKLNKNNYIYENSPVGLMLFDINGLNEPNKMGKDIFGVNIYKNGIKPFGEGRSEGAMKANCSPIGTGVLCSKYYLIGGKF